MQKRVILIVGLRRSGTTAVWRAFRLDDRIRCFNEPFNPQILNLSNDAFPAKEFYEEYDDLIRHDSATFWASYAPIDNIYELRAELSQEQSSYLTYLAGDNENVLFEMTRAHCKLASLAELFPDAVLVHLYRPAASFVSSVMLPNPTERMSEDRGMVDFYRTVCAKVAKTARRGLFWRRKYSGNMWGFDSLIGSSVTDPFAGFLGRHQIDGNLFYRLPAVARLLGYWKVSFEEVETEGRKLFGDRFVSVNFREFCIDPGAALRQIYAVADISYTDRDLEWVHKPHGAYQSSNDRWNEYADLIGLDRALL